MYSLGDGVLYGENSYFMGTPSAYYKPSHIALAKAVREFGEKNMMMECAKWEEACEIPKVIKILLNFF